VAQYGGTKVDDAERLKELEPESARLKKIVAGQLLHIDMVEELNKGNWCRTQSCFTDKPKFPCGASDHLQHAVSHGVCDRFYAGMNTELLQDTLHISPGCRHANAELGGDLVR
jgi:hypothetical protein